MSDGSAVPRRGMSKMRDGLAARGTMAGVLSAMGQQVASHARYGSQARALCASMPLHGNLPASFSGAAWAALADAGRLLVGPAVLVVGASSELPKTLPCVPLFACLRRYGWSRMVRFAHVSRMDYSSLE